MKDYLVYREINKINTRGGLTDDEVVVYFKKIKEESLKGVPLEENQARAVLILAFDHLIYYTIKMLGYDIQDENLYEEGLIGLIKAVDKYTLDMNNKFITFATICIKNQIWTYQRHVNRKKYNNFIEVGLDDTVNPESNITYKDVIMDDEDFVSDYEEKDFAKYLTNKLRAFFKHLRPVEQYCFVHGEGLFNMPRLTQKQLSKILNCTHSSISNYQNNAKRKLFLLQSSDDKLSRSEYLEKQRIKATSFKVLDFNGKISVEELKVN